MNESINAHVSEEAMLRWQAGDASETEQAHIGSCSECQARVEPLGNALSWFGAAARQWGEEKATLTQEWRAAKTAGGEEWRGSRDAAARQWRGMAGAWAAVGVALLLIFGIGLPRWNAHRAAVEAQARLQQEQQQKQELARDNALLDEVDQDVSQVVPEAMQPLSGNSANNSAGNATAGARTRQ